MIRSTSFSSRRTLAIAALAGVAPLACADDFLYFAEITPGLTDGHVSRIRTDGTDLTRLVQVGGGLRAVAVDSTAGKMYWTDVNNFRIARSNLNGSNVEDVITSGLIFPSAITVDESVGRLYWLDQDFWLAAANVDGSDFTILNETVTHRGVALDTASGKVYWSTSDTMFKGKILRSNLDGSFPEIVVTSAMPEFKPNAIALDLAGGKVYWTDYVIDAVCRADLDGTDFEILWVAGANHNPRGITLDLANGKMYWGQDNDFEATSGRIMRADLDGLNAEILINDIGLPNYLQFVSERTCVADLSGSSDPNDPGYGVPDGTIDASDFFFYLDQFALGNLVIADLTGSSDPNHSTYGVPAGVLDADDFFYYLDQFTAGCD